MTWKGIILAGGTGSRLFPLTQAVSKQLLPVYNKPLIYYPLSVQMLAGIREILIISTPHDLPQFKRLLGTGNQWGMHFEYAEQSAPRGLPEAFLIGADFIQDSPTCLALGDNILFGNELIHLLKHATSSRTGARIFTYPVRDPERYGVVTVDANGKPLTLEEKPENPRSNQAVIGLYFVDPEAAAIARTLKPSKRGELEILDLLQHYLDKGTLDIEFMGRGMAWLDAGTPHSLHQAASFVETIEERQGTMIACLEEIAFNQGFIDRNQLARLAADLNSSAYGQYLERLANGQAFYRR